jgi:NAD(P)-dependent dehydrogenase (short-subunit alcohol dehydrogenase family)
VAFQADLTERAAVDAAFAEVGERWGECNVLVNAAGPVEVGVKRFEDLDDEEWLATFDIGAVSAVRCVRAALPLLRAAQWARVVNLSAHSTKRQSPELVAYTASKAALTSLTKNLSQSLAPDGILVNTVSPGSFLSAGMRWYLRSLPAERNVDPDSLEDAMRVIAEDFGHPARDRSGDHVPRVACQQLHDGGERERRRRLRLRVIGARQARPASRSSCASRRVAGARAAVSRATAPAVSGSSRRARTPRARFNRAASIHSTRSGSPNHSACASCPIRVVAIQSRAVLG